MSRDNRPRRVSMQQMEILCEFLGSHKDIASAYNRSLQDKYYSCRKWGEVTLRLNATGDGCHKDWRGWCKYWVDFKAKLKRRVSAARAALTRNGVPSSEPPLSEIEFKFLDVLGDDFGQSSPRSNTMMEPFVQFAESTSGSTAQDGQKLNSVDSASNFSAQSSNADIKPDSFSLSSTPIPPALTAVTQRKRRRRDPYMAEEAARRAVVQSSQQRAKAALRNSSALERIATSIEEMRDSIQRIERHLIGANRNENSHYAEPSTIFLNDNV